MRGSGTMADKSKIEWLLGEDGIPGSTWNPIRARITDATGKVRVGWHCEHASIGCVGCYSEQTNKGFFQLGTKLPFTRASRDKVEIFLDEKTLRQPLRWKQGRKIFPCSMTDWAAEFVSYEWMDEMLAIAALCPQHEFLFLTKRADRVPLYLFGAGYQARHYHFSSLRLEGESARRSDIRCEITALGGRPGYERVGGLKWPLPNVTLGFSAENQEWFDKRWPHMRKVAEAGWKVNCSYEPALGPIDFGDALPLLSQVIFGGHSGPNAKPCDIQWARNTIAQCKAAGVACFVKQLGARPFEGELKRSKGLGKLVDSDEPTHFLESGHWLKLKDKKGGDWNEWPSDLRVREYPA